MAIHPRRPHVATRQDRREFSPAERISFRQASELLGGMETEPFLCPVGLDTVDVGVGYVVSYRWRKPRRRARATDSPITVKRVFGIYDERNGLRGSRVGVMVLSLTDEPDGSRSVMATVEALRLGGLHDGLLSLIERRARAAQADVVRINATAAATRLSAIDAGYAAQDHVNLLINLVNQVGVHVGHAINLDQRFEFDAPSAIDIWREGCDWVAAQLNACLPQIADGRCGAVEFNDRTGRVELKDHPEFPGATFGAMTRLSLLDLRDIRISGGMNGPQLPVVYAEGTDSAWNRVVACVPFTMERHLNVDIRDRDFGSTMARIANLPAGAPESD